MPSTGVGLGQLLLALDATMVKLVAAPRGLDLRVSSSALIDADDIRLGLAPSAGSADVFFLLGIGDDDIVSWIDRHPAAPVAIFLKHPVDAVVARATGAGIAVVAVDPEARWERLYRLVDHVFEHHGDGDSALDSGADLFGLAQSIADRTHGMVSIEDAASHVLAYSASTDEADELRRLSILGRAGPPEHLRWLTQWGVFGALRSGTDVVHIDARPELGLRPRRAIGVFRADPDSRRPPVYAGTIWVQQGAEPLAEDSDDVLRGAAVLAARIMSRLASVPSAHTVLVQQLLGLRERADGITAAELARDLGVPADGRAAVVGFDSPSGDPRLPDVMALSASAFHRDAQLAADGSRVYVLFPSIGKPSAVMSWTRGTVSALHTELGLALRAVIAAPVAGLAQVADTRTEIDRVLDSAVRHPGVLHEVTTLAEARTTVQLDEIVTRIAADPRLIDAQITALRQQDSILAHTLRAYLDSFGDVAAAGARLHVHPNTVRYRVRRIESLLGTTLADPDVRLLFSLSLRALG